MMRHKTAGNESAHAFLRAKTAWFTRASYALSLGLMATAAAPALAITGGETTPHFAPDTKHEAWTLGIKTLRPELVEESATVSKARSKKGWSQLKLKTDKASGAIRVISGAALSEEPRLKRVSSTAFTERALSFIANNKDSLGLDVSDVRLNKAATLMSKEDQFLKFSVYRDGLKVEDASLDFRFKYGKLVQVVNHSFSEAVTDDRPGLGNLDLKARESLIADEAAPLGDSYRVVKETNGYRLVRVAKFEVTTASDTYVVSVENASGKVFEIRPTKFNLAGHAKGHVYGRYYKDALQTLPYSGLTLSYEGGNVTTDKSGFFIDAPDDAQPKLDGFLGKLVQISLSTGTKVTVDGARDQDEWHVTYQEAGAAEAHEDKNIAQSMIFYHTNLIVNKAKQYIPDTAWLDRKLTANANLSQTCNAHWDGSTINFYSAGGGCANTALIADVVYHEWGHGLDANTGGIEDGAFSEGFGDIMSLIVTRSNILGIGFRTDGTPVRDLEPDRVYPRDAGGGVHSEGLIIGSTFWDLFKALRDTYGEDRAADMVAHYAFRVVKAASRYTDVYDALLVIDDDNADLSDQSPNYCIINKTFAAHGLARADEACNLASVDHIEVDDREGGNGNGIIEPGEDVKLYVTARNASLDAVNTMTAMVSIPNTQGVSVTDSSLAWEAIPARSTARSTDTAALSVSPDVACGEKLTATIAFAAENRSATVTQDLLIGRLDATHETLTADGLPLDIEDKATTTVELRAESEQWDHATTVHTARLKFDITHTYVGDLSVTLVAPNGKSKEVFRGSGSSDDVHFDQEISADFAGIPGQGIWTLKITDNASRDVGTLDAFELTLTPAKFLCE